MTRSRRVLWLLEYLGLDYTLNSVELVPPVDGKIFAQNTPTGRFPTLEDGDVGDEFTGADIMLAVSLLSINMLGPLTETHTHIAAYFGRLQTRPALTRAMQRS